MYLKVLERKDGFVTLTPPPLLPSLMALSDQATLIKGDSVAEPAHEIASA